MRNKERWRPSKYDYRNGRLVASKRASDVAAGSRLITNLLAAKYSENLRHYASGRLLDLGCGFVPLYGAYRDHVADCVCVDWANSHHKNEYLDMEWDLTQPLPFGDAEFDSIVLSDVLEHLPEPELLWMEMARVLKGGGFLIMNVPFLYWLHEEPNDFYRFTHYALRRFVDRAGLRLVKLEPIGGVLEVLADIVSKLASRVPGIGKSVAVSIQWLAGSFGKTSVGERLTRGTSARFPLGYFLVAEKQKLGA